jgi:two-component sensor histidine kinase
MKQGIICRIIFLITVSVMTMANAGAQPDSARIAQLLKAGSDYLFKPGNEKNDLDSALFFFNRALAISQSIHSDKWINASLKLKGDVYLEGNDLAPGVACFRQVTDYYHRKGDRRSEADTWSRLGGCITHYNLTFSAEKAKCYEQARQLYHLLRDTLNELDAYKNEADAHLWTRNPDLAEKELLEVVQGFKAIHSRKVCYTYDLLRAVSMLRGNLAKEVFYAMQMLRSIDSAEAKDSSTLYSALYTIAGYTYAKAGMWDSSLLYSRKGWEGVKADPGDYQDPYAAMRLVVGGLLHKDSAKAALDFLTVAIRQLPPATGLDSVMIETTAGKCYTALGDYQNAEKQYQKLTAFFDSHRALQQDRAFSQLYLEMLLSMGNFYLLSHRYAVAEAYEKKIQFGVKDLVGPEQRARIERFRAGVDSSMGRYAEALRHFETFQRLNDSIFGVQKAVQIQDLQIKYATEQKDKDLRIQAGDIQLLTNQNQLQQVQAGKSRILRNVMVAGLGVLLLLTGLIYNRYRLKQQKNHQLEVKQKEITDKNHQLERLLTENEWLLREVHHRVKNNLQVIMSLLKSQSDFLQDKAALAAVVESEHRVYAMSLIHQKLYKSNNVSSIGMPEYIGDLVEYLRYCFEVSGKLGFDLQVEPINLDVQQAVPVGLILNEVITNSFKYAFPCSDEDRITVRLTATGDGWLSLIIADNGRGLPPDFDPRENNSFGMLLIAGLTEDLEGTLHIDTHHGTAVHIRFKQSPLF